MRGRKAPGSKQWALAAAAGLLCLSNGCARTRVTVNTSDVLNPPDLTPVQAKAVPSHPPVELVRDGRAVAVVCVAPLSLFFL